MARRGIKMISAALRLDPGCILAQVQLQPSSIRAYWAQELKPSLPRSCQSRNLLLCCPVLWVEMKSTWPKHTSLTISASLWFSKHRKQMPLSPHILKTSCFYGAADSLFKTPHRHFICLFIRSFVLPRTFLSNPRSVCSNDYNFPLSQHFALDFETQILPNTPFTIASHLWLKTGSVRQSTMS